MVIRQNNYLKSEFIENSLKPMLSNHGIADKVKIKKLTNGREVGPWLEFKDQEGNLISLVIYTHRNSDQLVLNGNVNKTSLDGQKLKLPYLADSAHVVLGIEDFGDYNSILYQVQVLLISVLLQGRVLSNSAELAGYYGLVY